MENTHQQTVTDSCCSATTSPCCGEETSENIEQKTREYVEKTPEHFPEWVCGLVETPVGDMPLVSTEWTRADHWGQIKARTTSYRTHYTVPPGLYAIGKPNTRSDVFVSANYKLSFDILRRSLKGLNGWILVLDTKGINVWCAAGKGTFGTQELIKRITVTQLDKIVKRKWIIVPQLGAPGVNAAIVRKRTKFEVLFGPVSAQDIPAFIDGDYQASKEMRSIRFALLDRMVLTPIELNSALKRFPLCALSVLIIFGLQPSGILFKDAWTGGLPFLVLGLIAIIAGAFLTPVLLPFIPSRAFAIKGGIIGLLATIVCVQFTALCHVTSIPLIIMSYIFFPLLTSYIALQFTGSTTFTSLSGVKKELKSGIPIYIAGGVISLILLIVYKLAYWGII